MAHRRSIPAVAAIAPTTADDFQQFLSDRVRLLVTDSVRVMLGMGMIRDEVNAHLECTLMPDIVRMQRDAMGAFNAALNDPTAPSCR
jgi:hypothetical protein